MKREIRVIKSDGSWRFQAKRADEGRWSYYDEPLLEDLEEFREILFRKVSTAARRLRRCSMGRAGVGAAAQIGEAVPLPRFTALAFFLTYSYS